MKMSMHRASALSILWVTGFAVTFLAFLFLYWKIGIGPDASEKLFEAIIGQYAPLLGAVIGYHFGGVVSIRREGKSHAVAYRLAMTMSALWNLMTIGLVMSACVNADNTQDAIHGFATWIPKLSWLVAPSVGFFFGKSSEVHK